MGEPLDSNLSTDEWAHLSAQRALVYSWFSTLYAAEVPLEGLAAYLAGEAKPILDGFSVLGLDAQASRFQTALDGLRDVQDAHLELAADFAQIFLLDATAGALPYASSYDKEQTYLYGPAEESMRTFLASAELGIQNEFKEPADHLAIYLAVMARLIDQHANTSETALAAHDQQVFLQDALLSWLPDFNTRNQQVSPRFDFYPALSALLLVFVEDDAGFMEEIAHSAVANNAV